jgi:hypothetical protein
MRILSVIQFTSGSSWCVGFVGVIDWLVLVVIVGVLEITFRLEVIDGSIANHLSTPYVRWHFGYS